ncbi:glutathionylspermidine synthase family protein [Bacillus thuringiensis]|uniref:glutathionylspermidine synthase family protein n=1 Tax=Bacillus thuringiensis TaxID=1428 RepID=UPI0021D69D45|nr:glutathionylspermidine synthase family protein [Bacillus thuringiensis]MCU7667207.1 glutathionylspermidine synthase family protein [Bacillus thuringiensis]
MNAQKEKRNKFYGEIPNYWANMYGQEYSLYDVYQISEEEEIKIKTAADKIAQVFFKICGLLRHVDDETLMQMGFPRETLKFIKLKTIRAESVISRLDLVKVKDTYCVMEINSDTPTFIKELFHINGLVCDEFNLANPNKKEEERLGKVIRTAIEEAYSKLEKRNVPNIVFTSHDENEEDKYTAKYLQGIAGVASKYVPLEELRIIEGEGLIDPDGDIIDVLYRQTFPIENLILDKDPDTGSKVGLQLLELVQENKLAFINPPSAFLLQTKAVQAVIWGLHEENSDFFTEEEHQSIHTHFLPTYLEEEKFLQNEVPYIKKPCFGREGDTVEIYDNKGNKVLEDPNKSYTDYIAVYQKYVELPKTSFRTENETLEGHIMLGCFLLNGQPSAFGYRVGNRITDNLSYFLPVGTENIY